MKSLLSYSRKHFDPTKPRAEHEFWDSSANILARTLYKLLDDMGDVTYIDGDEYEQYTGGKYDFYIGISRNFKEIVESNDIGTSVYFAVNMHPAERKAILEDFSKSQNLSDQSLGWDLGYQTSMADAIDACDYILCVGNMAVYNSHIKYGVPRNKIKMLNYGVGKAVAEPKPAGRTPRLIYVASEVGLRKGFDIVYDMFSQPGLKDKDFHLDIVGWAAGEEYMAKVKKLETALGNKCTFHGWVDSGSPKYGELVGKNDFIIFPSLEEGQAGTVLDAISRGVVPILSQNAGVDFSPLGTLELVINSAPNRKILKDALALTPAEAKRLKTKSLEYYQQFHEDFIPSFKEAIQGCIAGQLYPKISTVLAIFNKEHTIISLLKHFELAAKAYGNVELHIIFDGCKDKTEDVVREYYKEDRGYPVTFEVTPNVFEVLSNNLGLKKSTGKYCAIVQDDNYIYDPNIFFEIANFLDKDPKAAILGCLAGVNFYPRGTTGLKGNGQIAMGANEVYWRQDAATDPTLQNSFFEVDACMRGPLILRKSFLEDYGYLDEAYIPFYMDDMDLAFRAKSKGFKVFAGLFNVENKSLTVASYNPERFKFWEDTMKKNSDIFYDRWKPTTEKDYMRVMRIPIQMPGKVKIPNYFPSQPRSSKILAKIKSIARLRRIFNTGYAQSLSNRLWQRRMQWIRNQAALIPNGSKVLDIGAGETLYRDSFAHTEYITQDFVQTPNFKYGKIDIVSDINHIPLPDASIDVIVCSEVFEHIPYPLEALKEISRLLRPGGKLIFSCPLGSGQHQKPYHFYGGYTRFWYEKFFPENGLKIVSLDPNGGLFGHIVELLWRSQPLIIDPLRESNSIAKKVLARVLQVLVYNLPSIILWRFENRMVIEDFTVCFFCIATREK